MRDEIRDAVFEAMEKGLDAQLRAMRRLRKGPGEPVARRPRKRMSQVDMAYDILKEARKPLHIAELLRRMRQGFGVQVDRESLVSALSKKVARKDRFVRTDKNTFGVLEDQR